MYEKLDVAGDRYFISDQHSRYFLTLTIVNWIDLFTRKEYRDIVVESLNYCNQAKGVNLYAWVIMSNHVHLIAGCRVPHRMSDFLRDFKKFTPKKIIDTIHLINESRSEWLLDKFSFEAKRSGRAKDFKVWKDSNHAIDLDHAKIDMMEKINYIHNNPVNSGIVRYPEEYIYSSAFDYSRRGKGLVNVIIV